ncbi:hypothetical protein [uncultured Flavobacterium sp.]|uniref:hypothetical protein n=1 Tax=uncultured Flavobacterium sp. TaxID=165435 RepID=UPI0030CA19CC
MNKSLLLKSLIVLISITSIMSCDIETIDPLLAPNVSTGVSGTYLLTSFITSVPTDLNGDGTTSINQMNETNCFNNSFIVLSAANTFISNSKGIEIDGIGTDAVVSCFSDPDYSGSWAQNGINITFTYQDAGVSYTDTFVYNGNTLTLSYSDGEVVGTSGGNPVYLTSDLTFVYTKQ